MFGVLQQGNSRHALHYCKELLKIKPDLKRMQSNLDWFQQRVGEEDAMLTAEGLPVPAPVSLLLYMYFGFFYSFILIIN